MRDKGGKKDADRVLLEEEGEGREN